MRSRESLLSSDQARIKETNPFIAKKHIVLMPSIVRSPQKLMAEKPSSPARGNGRKALYAAMEESVREHLRQNKLPLVEITKKVGVSRSFVTHVSGRHPEDRPDDVKNRIRFRAVSRNRRTVDRKIVRQLAKEMARLPNGQLVPRYNNREIAEMANCSPSEVKNILRDSRTRPDEQKEALRVQRIKEGARSPIAKLAVDLVCTTLLGRKEIMGKLVEFDKKTRIERNAVSYRRFLQRAMLAAGIERLPRTSEEREALARQEFGRIVRGLRAKGVQISAEEILARKTGNLPEKFARQFFSEWMLQQRYVPAGKKGTIYDRALSEQRRKKPVLFTGVDKMSPAASMERVYRAGGSIEEAERLGSARTTSENAERISREIERHYSKPPERAVPAEVIRGIDSMLMGGASKISVFERLLVSRNGMSRADLQNAVDGRYRELLAKGRLARF